MIHFTKLPLILTMSEVYDISNKYQLSNNTTKKIHSYFILPFFPKMIGALYRCDF